MNFYQTMTCLDEFIRTKIDYIEDRIANIGRDTGYRDDSDEEKIRHLEKCVDKLENFSTVMKILLTETEAL